MQQLTKVAAHLLRGNWSVEDLFRTAGSHRASPQKAFIATYLGVLQPKMGPHSRTPQTSSESELQ